MIARRMTDPQEFYYRLTRRMGGHRPGAHRGSGLGAGLEFATHMSLFDRPDPRRLDVRTSVRSLRDEWLVRVARQQTGVAVYAVVDVSTSMAFGEPKPKLHVAADFVAALGLSTFRMGDLCGMFAFDALEREDLYSPPMLRRDAGVSMAARLRACEARRGSIAGLEQVLARLAGRSALVFLVSDFHWDLARLGSVLDAVAHAVLVPVVIWDPTETNPPERNAVATLLDLESNARRTVWLRPSLRARWRVAVAQRRAQLAEVFARRGVRPFFIEGAFDADAMSRYFYESLG